MRSRHHRPVRSRQPARHPGHRRPHAFAHALRLPRRTPIAPGRRRHPQHPRRAPPRQRRRPRSPQQCRPNPCFPCPARRTRPHHRVLVAAWR
ncbi:MAG: hypothetical protein AAF570_23225, partial [Bacteroidota bacterium]